MAEFLVVYEVCKASFRPIPGSNKEFLAAMDSQLRGPSFLLQWYPTIGKCYRNWKVTSQNSVPPFFPAKGDGSQFWQLPLEWEKHRKKQ